ncbi:hypothetical protein NPIL_521321 [Nephila pilipes]|uniref:Uncharacterized protein n=1 Tax=Nephila pilipes TaxID=299642 RepID=A0A8X6NGB5_NEPPI|nr:hypothetical protein NPIL_521321 [Nephila pilipes]
MEEIIVFEIYLTNLDGRQRLLLVYLLGMIALLPICIELAFLPSCLPLCNKRNGAIGQIQLEYLWSSPRKYGINEILRGERTFGVIISSYLKNPSQWI